MPEVLCPRCHKAVGEADAAFCPFCGEKLIADRPDIAAVRAQADPAKKHERLLALQSEHPGDLEIAEEILHLGRLYERGKKGADFTIIKCFVLNVYLEPGALKKSVRDQLRQEIFHHPDLDRCLALAEDKTLFLRRYLTRLSEEFIRLFLRGSSLHMHAVFGFVNNAKAPKHLARPAAQMLLAMHGDEALDPDQRALLTQAFYAAFARQLDGETQYLDGFLQKLGLSIETQ